MRLLFGGLTLRSLTGDDDSTDDVASVQPTSTVTAATASADATTDPSLQPNEDISDPDTEADPTNDGAPPPEEGLEELSSPDDLAVFASDAVGIFPPTVDNTVEPADTAEPPVVEKEIDASKFPGGLVPTKLPAKRMGGRLRTRRR